MSAFEDECGVPLTLDQAAAHLGAGGSVSCGYDDARLLCGASCGGPATNEGTITAQLATPDASKPVAYEPFEGVPPFRVHSILGRSSDVSIGYVDGDTASLVVDVDGQGTG